MRDAIKTGIALILLTLAGALLLIAVMGYMRAEGWFNGPGQRSLYIQSEPEKTENRATTGGRLWS